VKGAVLELPLRDEAIAIGVEDGEYRLERVLVRPPRHIRGTGAPTRQPAEEHRPHDGDGTPFVRAPPDGPHGLTQ
jgi:hypothetical protein